MNRWSARKVLFFAFEVMGLTMFVATFWVAPWWAALIVGVIGYFGRWAS